MAVRIYVTSGRSFAGARIQETREPGKVCEQVGEQM